MEQQVGSLNDQRQERKRALMEKAHAKAIEHLKTKMDNAGLSLTED